MPENTELVAALEARGLLTKAQVASLRKATEKSDKTTLEAIRDQRIVFPEVLAQVRAELLGVAYINLKDVNANPDAMRDISKQAAATYKFFAFDIRDNKLHIAMDEPDNFQALEAVKFISKKRGLLPEVFLSSKEAIDAKLGGASEIQAEIGGALRDFGQELEQVDNVISGDDKEVEKYIEDAPVTKVVAVIIRHAIEGDASDIHIEPAENSLRIRYRIDGALHTSLSLPMRVHSAVISRVKILSNLKIDESRLPQDGRFSSTAEGKSFDFRVSTMPTVFGEKVVLRILDKTQGAPSFEELGLWGKQQQTYLEHLKSPHGIILVSGPTGAGKSTTLFSSIAQINNAEVNISTLEDPVEYETPGVNQTQVNPDIGLTFASGLRNLLRQDPDVLMVGEIRDQETAGLSIHASLTGHLVLSTIHTNDAISTIPRLVDMGIDPYLLAATLRLLAAQRLVPKLCSDCRQQVPIPPNIVEHIETDLASIPEEYKTEPNQRDPKFIYQAHGCPTCQETGMDGRIGVFEAVPIERTMREAMNKNSGYDILHDVARNAGYLSMRQDGILKSLTGHVRFEDVLRVTSED